MSDITSKITVKNKIQGKIEATKIYPDLENLTVTPSKQQQSFNHKDSYGYDNVIVKGIDCNSINITPTKNKQVFEGMYDNVTVDGVQGEILNITPSETQQSKTGLYETVNVEAIQTEEKEPTLNFGSLSKVEITPTTGKYIKKVTINKPSNLVPDIIKAGENVFGINGSLEILDTSDADATTDDLLAGKVAYVNGEKVVGTLEVSEDLTQYMMSADNLFTSNTTLTEIKDFNSKNIKSMSNTFKGCTALTKASFVNTNNVTNMNYLFNTCSSLQEVTGLDTSLVSNGSYMFAGCTALITAPELNMSNCTSASNMFKGCTNLKQVSLTTSTKLLTIDNMFSESGIEVAPYFITSKATSVTNMFYKCKSLKEVPAYQFNSATVLTNVFNYCTKLETVPVLGVANAVSMQNMFQYCNKLTDESLNNIMQMCINATKVTNASYKKLSYLGLTSTQATRCQSLSNYQAFLDAGWTTGY